MPVVVADTSPINYLVQIDAIELLPKLFGKIAISAAVHAELTHRSTSAVVRAWMAQGSPWLEVRPNPDHGSAMPASLDVGERTTIELAGVLDADLIVMDDRNGVAFARAQGFAVTGTLGVLDLAAQRGLIDLFEAFARAESDDLLLSPGAARRAARAACGQKEIGSHTHAATPSPSCGVGRSQCASVSDSFTAGSRWHSGPLFG